MKLEELQKAQYAAYKKLGGKKEDKKPQINSAPWRGGPLPTAGARKGSIGFMNPIAAAASTTFAASLPYAAASSAKAPAGIAVALPPAPSSFHTSGGSAPPQYSPKVNPALTANAKRKALLRLPLTNEEIQCLTRLYRDEEADTSHLYSDVILGRSDDLIAIRSNALRMLNSTSSSPLETSWGNYRPIQSVASSEKQLQQHIPNKIVSLVAKKILRRKYHLN